MFECGRGDDGIPKFQSAFAAQRSGTAQHRPGHIEQKQCFEPLFELRFRRRFEVRKTEHLGNAERRNPRVGASTKARRKLCSGWFA